MLPFGGPPPSSPGCPPPDVEFERSNQFPLSLKERSNDLAPPESKKKVLELKKRAPKFQDLPILFSQNT